MSFKYTILSCLSVSVIRKGWAVLFLLIMKKTVYASLVLLLRSKKEIALNPSVFLLFSIQNGFFFSYKKLKYCKKAAAQKSEEYMSVTQVFLSLIHSTYCTKTQQLWTAIRIILIIIFRTSSFSLSIGNLVANLSKIIYTYHIACYIIQSIHNYVLYTRLTICACRD